MILTECAITCCVSCLSQTSGCAIAYEWVLAYSWCMCSFCPSSTPHLARSSPGNGAPLRCYCLRQGGDALNSAQFLYLYFYVRVTQDSEYSHKSISASIPLQLPFPGSHSCTTAGAYFSGFMGARLTPPPKIKSLETNPPDRCPFGRRGRRWCDVHVSNF